jgi:hypothetical protein
MLLLDDYIAGFIKSLPSGKSRQQALQSVRNSILIWSGLFRGSWKLCFLRFSWEIIQTLLGFLAAHLANLLRPVRRIASADGCSVIEGGGYKGSLSLGTYILLYPGGKTAAGQFLFMHEFGHSLQSRESGPLYLFKYGIPSQLNNKSSWVDQDANQRAAVYFEKKTRIPLMRWKQSQFHLPDKGITHPKLWEYLLLFAGIGIFLLPLLNLRKGR